MNELLTERQAAALLHVSVKSLQGWRSRGGGPRCVRYSVADLQAFIDQAVRRSTSDRGPTPHRPAQIRTEHLLGKTGRRLETPGPTAPEQSSPPSPIPRLRFRARLHRADIKKRPGSPRT